MALSVGLVATSGCRDEPQGDGDDDTGSTGAQTDTDEPSPDTTEGETDTEAETEEPPPEASVPPPGGLRRLLAHQYVSSVEYLLGSEAAAATLAPPDPGLGTFDALATLSSVPSVLDIESYEGSAGYVARAAVDNPARLADFVPCVTEGPYDESCYESLARDFGRVAWRRPLSDAQVDRLVAVATTAREWGDDEFMPGVEYMLTAIVQSPYFLYLVELGEPADEYRELTGEELATRMSFFLLGRTPSLGVLDRAQSGELDTDEGVRSLAQDLLEDPQARDTVSRFFGELLTVRDLPNKGKDPDLFPMFSEQLAASMIEETRRLVDEVVFVEDGSAMRLFDADYTFINDDLAALYGMDPVGEWTRVDLPEERAGVLSLSGWLSMSSHNTVNSPTRRGLFVMEQLLCVDLPPPPPRVNPEPIEPVEGQTLRESLTTLTQDAPCSDCHILTDSIGFGFEHFNPVGAWQDQDNGQPIDASGSIPGVGEFNGAGEMADLLITTPNLSRCLVDKAYAANLGFVPEGEMDPALAAVDQSFIAADHNLKHMLVELTASPVFRLVDEPK